MDFSDWLPADGGQNYLESLFKELSQRSIKEEVDEHGLDAFIETAARYAAFGGFVGNIGGVVTMWAGIPAEILNNIVQQFRITLAVIYARTGNYQVTFPEFFKIVGLSLGVEVGASIGKAICIQVVGAIVARIAATSSVSAFLRWIPFVAGGVCAGVNYAYIHAIGAALKELNLRGPGRPRLVA